jgi:hypothetical protein
MSSILDTEATRERVFFNQSRGDVADRFSERRDTKVHLMKKLLCRPHFRFRPDALQDLHHRDNGHRAIASRVD